MPLWDVIVSIFWFMILFTWIWLLISIFDEFERAKAKVLGRGPAMAAPARRDQQAVTSST